jgi:hypothetical protein
MKRNMYFVRIRIPAHRWAFLLSGIFNLFRMLDNILKIKILTTLDTPSPIKNSKQWGSICPKCQESINKLPKLFL